MIMTPERLQLTSLSVVFIVNFEQFLQVILVFLLLTLNMQILGFVNTVFESSHLELDLPYICRPATATLLKKETLTDISERFF